MALRGKDGPAVRCAAQRSCAMIEPLEMRRLLSGTGYVINSLLDTVEADGFLTLREAIQAANTNLPVNEAAGGSETETDAITFDPALFAGGAQVPQLREGELSLAGDVSITGPGSDLLTIRAGQESRVLMVQSGVIAGVAGVTLTGGNVSLSVGAGVYNAGTLTMTDVVIEHNDAMGPPIAGYPTTASAGGFFNSGTATLWHVTISHNSAALWAWDASASGGGIYNDETGTLTILDSVIAGNNATASADHLSGAKGGGIFNLGTLVVSNSIIQNNVASAASGVAFPGASAFGAGVFNSGTLTVTDVTVSENLVSGQGAGGGFFNVGTMHVSDVMISNNMATVGGGVSNGGTMTLANGTISGNEANAFDALTGGPYRAYGGGVANDGTLVMANVSVSENHAYGDGGGVFNSGILTMTDGAITHNSAGGSYTNSPWGGGVYNEGTIELSGVTIEDNTVMMNTLGSASGGGVFNAGTATLSHVTVSGNHAIANGGDVDVEAGGIFNASTGTLRIDQTVVSANYATAVGMRYGNARGGGFNNQGKATVTSSIVEGNQTTADGSSPTSVGAGVYNRGDLTMTCVSVHGNSASGGMAWGAGIFNAGPLRLVNSTVSENSLSTDTGPLARGAGLYNSEKTAVLVNVTITGNSSPGHAGGLAYDGAAAYGNGLPTLQNTILAGNTAPNDPDLWSVMSEGTLGSGSDYNLIGVLPSSQIASAGPHTLHGTAAVPLDPMLGPPTEINGQFVHPLLPGSPAINAGSNDLAVDAEGDPLTTDQLGNARIAAGTVDIGAVEYRPQMLSIAGTSGDDAISVSGDADLLSWRINSAPQLSIPRSLVTGLCIDASGGADDIDFDLDLLDNDLVIKANPQSAKTLLGSVTNAIQSARNTQPLWQGPGLRSSTAAADSTGLHGLAVLLNDNNGQPIDPDYDINTILVKYALNGDMDLNGSVNTLDYARIDQGFLSQASADPLTGYQRGDLDYSGRINTLDYALIDSAFLGQHQSPSAPARPAAASKAIAPAKKRSAKDPLKHKARKARRVF